MDSVFTKTECLRVFERAGYTFVGYSDTGYGYKAYHFTHPDVRGEVEYSLSLLRIKARHLDMRMWLDARNAELKAGIQETLFSDSEIECHYAIQNPLAV